MVRDIFSASSQPRRSPGVGNLHKEVTTEIKLSAFSAEPQEHFPTPIPSASVEVAAGSLSKNDAWIPKCLIAPPLARGFLLFLSKKKNRNLENLVFTSQTKYLLNKCVDF